MADPTLERMDDFFAARVSGYDEHMLDTVVGCKEGYQKMTELLPDTARDLLDLGCGTGLELDQIYQRLPELCVTGVDMTKAMLDKLRQKHPDKPMTLILGSYLDRDFGDAAFDAAVSFETLHHLTHAQKAQLYRAVYRSLRKGGVYIEADYMVLTQGEEDEQQREYQRLLALQGKDRREIFHYDTPFTIRHQQALLQEAGFAEATQVFRVGNTTMLYCTKS